MGELIVYRFLPCSRFFRHMAYVIILTGDIYLVVKEVNKNTQTNYNLSVHCVFSTETTETRIQNDI